MIYINISISVCLENDMSRSFWTHCRSSQSPPKNSRTYREGKHILGKPRFWEQIPCFLGRETIPMALLLFPRLHCSELRIYAFSMLEPIGVRPDLLESINCWGFQTYNCWFKPADTFSSPTFGDVLAPILPPGLQSSYVNIFFVYLVFTSFWETSLSCLAVFSIISKWKGSSVSMTLVNFTLPGMTVKNQTTSSSNN